MELRSTWIKASAAGCSSLVLLVACVVTPIILGLHVSAMAGGFAGVGALVGLVLCARLLDKGYKLKCKMFELWQLKRKYESEQRWHSVDFSTFHTFSL